MNKEKYIIELRKRLSLLSSDEVDDIISEYLDYIKQKQNEGTSEAVALEQLGNVNELAKKILKSYKISDTYIKLFVGKEKVIDEFNDFVRKFADASTTLISKIESSISDIANTVYKETKKFSEEKISEVKKRFNNKEKTDDTDTKFEEV